MLGDSHAIDPLPVANIGAVFACLGREHLKRGSRVDAPGITVQHHGSLELHAGPARRGFLGAQQLDRGTAGTQRLMRARDHLGVALAHETAQCQQLFARVTLKPAPQLQCLVVEVEVVSLFVGVVHVAGRAVRGAPGVSRLKALKQ